MAVACGPDFTSVVTGLAGDVWAWGAGDWGQLGLESNEYQPLPARVGGGEMFGSVIIMAAGHRHTAVVTADGAVWTWGNGSYGQLGQGDVQKRRRPMRLGMEVFGSSAAVMVACGDLHILVLTVHGSVWACGFGGSGRLGHGDTANKRVLTFVGERFGRGKTVFVAAGGAHSVAVQEAGGGVWTWGKGAQGRLGHGDEQDRIVPTQVSSAKLDGGEVIMVAAGMAHTVAVMQDGEMFVWGDGGYGQLGLGDVDSRLAPAHLGADVVFAGSRVLMAACGAYHTLAVTEDGLWSWGLGKDGALGHSDRQEKLLPTRVDAMHFDHAKIVSAASGPAHSAVVTEHGALYTFGGGVGLGHGDEEHKLVPTRVAPYLLQGARVGRCHSLPPLHALAFAMGTHDKLGSTDERDGQTDAETDAERDGQTDAAAHCSEHQPQQCPYVSMPADLVQRVIEACVSGPEGRAGELEGVLRLLGGGRTKVQD